MKILVVDDKEENCYLLETLLTGNGFVTATATNGKQALKLLRSGRVDLIISDILMPVMDGFQLCRECKGDEELKDIPFVFYTATYTNRRDKEFALNLGADRYIRKPIEPEEFTKIIQGVIADAAKGKLKPKKRVLREEETFKLYSERLVAKLEQKVLDVQRENAQRKEAEEKLQERVKELSCLYHANHDMQKNLSSEQLCRRIVQYLIPAVQFPEIAVAVVELEGKRYTSERYTDRLSHGLHAEIRSGEKGLGQLSVYYTEDKPFLIPQEQDLLNTIGADLGLWIQNRQTEERLEDMLQGVIQALGQTTETRDPYTAGHQRHVTQLASAIAEEMKVSSKQLEAICTAGLMHDIGKISVPAEILSKASRLTDIEFSLIKAHPQAAYDILKTIDFPWPVADIVLQHHERLDGSGYPHALKGEEILLEARILSVADVVEAMSSHRPYRPALGLDKALEEIEKNKGKLYDSEVADACIRLFTEERFKFQSQ